MASLTMTETTVNAERLGDRRRLIVVAEWVKAAYRPYRAAVLIVRPCDNGLATTAYARYFDTAEEAIIAAGKLAARAYKGEFSNA